MFLTSAFESPQLYQMRLTTVEPKTSSICTALLVGRTFVLVSTRILLPSTRFVPNFALKSATVRFVEVLNQTTSVL